MSRAKLGLMCFAAALVVSAMMASSSFANFTLTTTPCEGTVTTVCYSTTEGGALFEFSGSEAITTSKEPSTESFLKASFGTEEVDIVCTGAKTVGGELVQTEPLVKVGTVNVTTGIEFTTCALQGKLAEKCAVKTTLTTLPITGTPASLEDINFAPKSGTTFIEIEFANSTGTCPATIKGTKKVTGTQLCLLSGPGVDALLHTLVCSATGSSLKLGENTATFALSLDTTLTNATTDFWSLSNG